MRWIDRAFCLSLWVVSLIFVSRFCEKQTNGFTLWRIASDRPFHEEYATRPLTIDEQKELEKALDQPYTYFGSGGQAHAFFSKDGNYVVKFFKQRLYTQSKILNLLPLPKFLQRYRKKKNWKREDKFQRDFTSYKISFEELQAETGVIYVHLNKTRDLDRMLEVTDWLGIVHQIDLDQYDFIVQKKAEKTHDRIAQLMNEKRLDEAKAAVGQLVHLISNKAKKGYRDRDPNIETNCGFLEGRAVKIDVGRILKCPEMKTKQLHNKDIEEITAPFEVWLNSYYPELLPTLEEYRKEAMLK